MAGVAVGGQGNESPKATRSPAAFSGAGRAVREQQRPRTRGEARPGVCEQPGGGRMKVTRGWDVSQLSLIHISEPTRPKYASRMPSSA